MLSLSKLGIEINGGKAWKSAELCVYAYHRDDMHVCTIQIPFRYIYCTLYFPNIYSSYFCVALSITLNMRFV